MNPRNAKSVTLYEPDGKWRYFIGTLDDDKELLKSGTACSEITAAVDEAGVLWVTYASARANPMAPMSQFAYRGDFVVQWDEFAD